CASETASASHYIVHVSYLQLCPDEDGSRRGDVVRLGAQFECGNADIDQSHLCSGYFQFASGQSVLMVEFAQIEAVIGGRHAGRILVPVQEIEREWLLAEKVIVHDVGPDQVARAHHVEDVGHARAIEIAALGHHFLEVPELRFIDEQEEIPGLGEVDLGSEEGRRGEDVLLPCAEIGKGRGEQGSSDAVADAI